MCGYFQYMKLHRRKLWTELNRETCYWNFSFGVTLLIIIVDILLYRLFYLSCSETELKWLVFETSWYAFGWRYCIEPLRKSKRE